MSVRYQSTEKSDLSEVMYVYMCVWSKMCFI